MKLRALLYMLAGSAWMLVPAIALAQAPLVPCQGWDCNWCSLGQLAQAVINFTIGLSFPIAAILFAYAGWLYYSNRENPEKIEKAHRIFFSVLLGFAIAIGAWMVVQTTLKVMAGDAYQGWNSLNPALCNNANRPMNTTITQLLQSAGILPLNTQDPNVTSTANSFISCPAGSSVVESGTGCFDPSTGNFTQPNQTTCPDGATPTGNGGCQTCWYDYNVGTMCEPVAPMPTNTNFGGCSLDAMSGWGSSASAFSCIARAESSCNPSAVGDNGFSIGLYQINMSANNVTCNGQTLRCPTAFSGRYTCSNGVCTRPQITNPTLAQQCQDALMNAQCNFQTAQAIYNQNGYRPWTTARGCGY